MEGELDHREAAAAFLDVASKFRLGNLDTEQPHPRTMDLSRWAKEDPAHAVARLREIDVEALQALRDVVGRLDTLCEAIHRTLRAGRCVYLVGCGATGRLSLSLELFCRREGMVSREEGDQVIGFMAGGDAALIRSIERFEDRPAFGERQLCELGFACGDLLVASTEGGETPFVIGATEAAARLSSERPFFLYGNPDRELAQTVERSKRVLENPAIEKVNLATGPMALSGSTRMQASTVLMAAIGFALLARDGDVRAVAERQIDALIVWWRSLEASRVADFVIEEASIYQRGEYVLYEPSSFGITVLTDTTERSPTFALVPFERFSDVSDLPSWCYVHLEGTTDAEEAWEKLLGRAPRTLEWGELKALTGRRAIAGFDFSNDVMALRHRSTGSVEGHHRFEIDDSESALRWSLRDVEASFPWPNLDRFAKHLALKMILNVHSTLVMGRMGRYEGNVMTYVSPTNNKLIDRAVRYARQILKRQYHLTPSYDDVVRTLFKERRHLKPDESIVLRVVRALSGSSAPSPSKDL